MIGKLKGIVDEIDEDWCIIDAGGVGYVAFCSSRTLSCVKEGDNTSLFIETYVREDVIRLFGFATREEREWFRLLLNNVQGVGAKVAMALLSTLSPAELAAAITSNDTASIIRTPGVGKKVAERIVSELKARLPAQTTAASLPPAAATGREAGRAVNALANLGYPRDVAVRAVAAASKKADGTADTALLIRLGVKELSGSH